MEEKFVKNKKIQEDKNKLKNAHDEENKSVKNNLNKVIKNNLNKLRNKKAEKEQEELNKLVSFNLLEVVIIILITGITVSIASGIIIYNKFDKLNNSAQNINKSELKEFEEVYNKIVNDYVETVDKQKLLESAINGMYDSLNDDFSSYLSKEDTETLQEQLKGEYSGVGIEILTYESEDETSKITIINKVFSNSPAEKAGLKAGDIIKKIDGIEVVDSSSLSDYIKNGNKNTYKITYVRDEKENTVDLIKEHIIIDSVTSEVYDNVGYIKLDTFSSTTKDQIIKKIDSFDNNIESLIIDLRDNTGGYLNVAYDISDLFVEKGKTIYQLKDRNGIIEKYNAKNDVYKKFKNIVILINENSASASEVLALALRESANAKIVGVTSYGKGTVQEKELLSSGAMVKYTTSYWLSPNGNSINKIGITPDIVEKNIENQLNKAIEATK